MKSMPVLLGVAALLSATPIVVAQNAIEDLARQIYESELQLLDPPLLKLAEERGLYDREAFPILRAMNPYYIRGDFNGDGEMDVAFWVRNAETQQRGVAIVHSTLDELYIFGAGRPRPSPQTDTSNEVRVDGWRLIPVGYTDDHLYSDIPEINVREGQSFIFEREALAFEYFGKAEFVFYWVDGRYWEFGTAD